MRRPATEAALISGTGAVPEVVPEAAPVAVLEAVPEAAINSSTTRMPA